MSEKPLIPVACGCIVNDRGEILICQRPPGKIAAGKWEFPGGKIEAGESGRQALVRELREELGIAVREARPLIRIRHEYSDRWVVLDTWLVSRFDGTPTAHEKQGLAWTRPERLHEWDLLAADGPIVNALRLSPELAFTPEDISAPRTLDGVPKSALLRLRAPRLSDSAYVALARRWLPEIRARGLRLILDRAPEQVAALGADGWHATAAVLRALDARPAVAWAGASCHDATELRRARELEFDYAVFGPVQATPTHPQAQPLGWEGFALAVRECGIPVYALGGVGPRDLAQAWRAGAQGVAGIRAYWS